MVISKRLTTKQIEALVAWIEAGKPAKDFDPSQAGKKGPKAADPGPEPTSDQPVEAANRRAQARLSHWPRGITAGKTPRDGWGGYPQAIRNIRARMKDGQGPGFWGGLLLVLHALWGGFLSFLENLTGVNKKSFTQAGAGKGLRKLIVLCGKGIWHLFRIIVKEPFKFVWSLLGLSSGGYWRGRSSSLILGGAVLYHFSPGTFHESGISPAQIHPMHFHDYSFFIVHYSFESVSSW